MAYPGATPEEIEESIVVKIEDQVSGLDDVKAVKSLAAPGIASVRVQMDSGTDMNRALDDVESAVNRIHSFPAGAERPTFREMDNRFSMIRLIVHGDVSERSLKETGASGRGRSHDPTLRLPGRGQRGPGLRDLHRGAGSPAECPGTHA